MRAERVENRGKNLEIGGEILREKLKERAGVGGGRKKKDLETLKKTRERVGEGEEKKKKRKLFFEERLRKNREQRREIWAEV